MSCADLFQLPVTCLLCHKINFLIPPNAFYLQAFLRQAKWLAHCMAVPILIDCWQLFLIDVMDSPDWLWADSWYHVNDIVKAGGLSASIRPQLELIAITPSTAILWGGFKTIIVSQYEGSFKMTLSPAHQSFNCKFKRYGEEGEGGGWIKKKIVALVWKDESAVSSTVLCGLITLSRCSWGWWLDAKVKI